MLAAIYGLRFFETCHFCSFRFNADALHCAKHTHNFPNANKHRNCAVHVYSLHPFIAAFDRFVCFVLFFVFESLCGMCMCESYRMNSMRDIPMHQMSECVVSRALSLIEAITIKSTMTLDTYSLCRWTADNSMESVGIFHDSRLANKVR